MVCTGYYVDSADGRCIPSHSSESVMIYETGNDAKIHLVRFPEMNGFAWNKIYRVSVIREHHLSFSDEVGTTEDLDFAYKFLCVCGCVAQVSDIHTYHYFQCDNSATNASLNSKQIRGLTTYENIIEN